jgi:hypothetical protein
MRLNAFSAERISQVDIAELKIGNELTNRELMQLFGVGNTQGMRRSLANNLIVLTSQKRSTSSKFKNDSVYHDRWEGDVFLYTGEGLKGDQKLTGQNKTVAESRENGVAIHLFETPKANSYIYVGVMELGDQPFPEPQQDIEGKMRQVWVFPLRRKFDSSPIFSEVEPEIEQSGEFNPTDIVDGRKKVLASIVRRRGQRKFRNSLLECYGGKCAVTGSAVTELLDAAHIVPYKGDQTNDVRNGLLLRTDIHTLFDLGLISIDPETWRVVSAKRLSKSQYSKLEGRKLRLPLYQNMQPSVEALRRHKEDNGL